MKHTIEIEGDDIASTVITFDGKPYRFVKQAEGTRAVHWGLEPDPHFMFAAKSIWYLEQKELVVMAVEYLTRSFL